MPVSPPRLSLERLPSNNGLDTSNIAKKCGLQTRIGVDRSVKVPEMGRCFPYIETSGQPKTHGRDKNLACGDFSLAELTKLCVRVKTWQRYIDQ